MKGVVGCAAGGVGAEGLVEEIGSGVDEPTLDQPYDCVSCGQARWPAA
jgi:hypothetical protein